MVQNTSVYRLVIKKSALKSLRRMPQKTAARMLTQLEKIAADPNRYTGDWKRLAGSRYWRLRVGAYRAICELRDDELLLILLAAGPRGDVYK